MPNITAKLSAELFISRASLDGSCSGGPADPATAFRPELLPANRSVAGADAGQKLMTVNSPGGFVALSLPASLRARVVYFRPLSGAFTGVRLTHATAGAVEYPVGGMILAEFPELEQVSAVAVRGEGSFEWAAWGVLV